MTTSPYVPAPRTERNWILTAGARRFWPLDPRAEDVDIEDIAHALAMKCRYTGHCRDFYSVAQHSVLVSYVVPFYDAFWGLMHDATEAYLPDVARPVKYSSAFAEFRQIEDHLAGIIADHFGLPLPIPETVHQADRRLYVTEMRDLMPPKPRSEWKHDAMPLPECITPYPPKQAKAMFLRRFEMLKETRKMRESAAESAA